MHRTAFSLVELLVVIGLVGILSMILVTFIRTSAAKARDAESLSNLSQIAKSLLLYHSDQGAFPYAERQGPWSCWAFDINPYLGMVKLGDGTDSIFKSPNESKHNPIADYGVNNWVVNPSQVSGAPVPPRRLASISRPSKKVLVSDARVTTAPSPGEGSWQVAGWRWVSQGEGMASPYGPWPPRNTGDRVFAAFCDGHVESVAASEWVRQRAEFFNPDLN